MTKRGMFFSSDQVGFAAYDDSGLIPQKMPSFLFESDGAPHGLLDKAFVLSRVRISWWPLWADSDRVAEQIASRLTVQVGHLLHAGSISESETNANVTDPAAPRPMRGLGDSTLLMRGAQDEYDPYGGANWHVAWKPSDAVPVHELDYTYLDDGGIYCEPGQHLSVQTQLFWGPDPVPNPPGDARWESWMFNNIMISFFLQEID